MADNNDVKITLSGEDNLSPVMQTAADNVEGATQQMAADTEASATKISASFEQMSASFKKVGTTMAVTGGLITAALTGLAVAGGSEVQEQARLKIAIENTGASYEAVKGQIDALLESQMKFTNFSDSEQTNALNNLVLVTGSVTDAMSKLPLVLDLAAAKGIDLTTASQYIGKAMQGEWESLNRLLPGIKDCTTASEALAFIQGKVAGAAEATANPMTQLKNSFASLAEKIGSVLLPIFKGFLDIVTPIINAVKNWIDNNRTLATVIGGVLLTLGVLLTVGGGLILLIVKVVEIYKAWQAIQIALNIAMYANPIGIIIAAIAALIAIIALVITHFDTMKRWFVDGCTVIKNAFVAAWNFIKDIFISVWNTIKTVFETVWHAIHNTFATVINALMTGIEKFVNFFISGINTIIRGLNAIPFVNIGLIADVSLPKIPILDTGAYVAPTPGGTIARLAASGVGEYVMTPNQLAAQTGGSGGTVINIYPTGMMMGTAAQLAAALREELLKIGSRNVNVGLT